MSVVRRVLTAFAVAAVLASPPLAASAFGFQNDGHAGVIARTPNYSAHQIAGAFVPVPGSFTILLASGPSSDSLSYRLLVHATDLEQPAATSVKVTVYDHPENCSPEHPTALGTVCAPPNLAQPTVGGHVYFFPNQPVDAAGKSTFLLTVPGTHPAGAEVQLTFGTIATPNPDNGGHAKEIAYFGAAATSITTDHQDGDAED